MQQFVEVNPTIGANRPITVNRPAQGDFEKMLGGTAKLIAACALTVVVLVFVGVGLELFFGRIDLQGVVKEVGGAVVIGAFVVVVGFLGVAALVGLYEGGEKTVKWLIGVGAFFKKIGDIVNVLHAKRHEIIKPAQNELN